MKRLVIALLLVVGISNVFALDISKMRKAETQSQSILELLSDDVVEEEDPYSWIVIPTVDTTPPKVEVPNSEYYDQKEKQFTGFFSELLAKVKKIFEQ